MVGRTTMSPDVDSSRATLRTLLYTALAGVVIWRWHATHPPASPPPPSSVARFAQCDGSSPVLVGTHHKSGTVLLTHLLRDACRALRWTCVFNHDGGRHCASASEARALGARICFLQHGIRFQGLAAAPPGAEAEAYRFVHAVRDPLELVLSGYSYHLRTTERWANRPERRWNGTTYRRYLNALPLEAGLLAEMRHSARDNLKTMPRLHARVGARPCTLTLRFEDFSRDWEGTLSSLWALLGVREAAQLAALARVSEKHNVYRHNTTRGRHVSSTSSDRRTAMRQLLRRNRDAIARIREVRRQIGYPRVGQEGSA
uniref:Sulfotransferase domain-containing protein n=1 Tax=Emiliania huxleyi TaxID=2903 RepID=A0A7S3X6W7_EMIHU